MGYAQGGPAVGQVPTREAIEQAFTLADGEPKTVGELAFALCDVLGVDTEGVSGSYDLRRLFPYQVYTTLLKRMVRDGEVVALARGEWNQMSRGALCAHGNTATAAYATADAARQMRAALRAAGPSDPKARRELALHLARQRVLREHAADVEAYASAWMKQDQAKGDDG